MDFGTIQNGYPGLAKLIGPNVDHGLGIFRQFAEFNARNLLYMQAELLCLQKELALLTYTDHNGPDPKPNTFAHSVWNMRETPTCPQWAKVLEIREKLRAYNMHSPAMPY
ncbi:hypothetical protein EK21DRAFT_112967 [Setomelanomma holmii]|uniref:DUF6594 domain-containing protein n=1 Tax=Setomelanomma holmii TaxID=210430 RepID=A0A9P4H8E0_9PLEO|nr:hypothetical protein EK21DRAFT_112967 [Setomelanomma holmii]